MATRSGRSPATPARPRIAEILTDVVGTRVSYVTVDWSSFREQMGAELEAMMRWFEDVGYEADVPSLRRLHPDLRSFRDYAGEAFGTDRADQAS